MEITHTTKVSLISTDKHGVTIEQVRKFHHEENDAVSGKNFYPIVVTINDHPQHKIISVTPETLIALREAIQKFEEERGEDLHDLLK